MSQTNPHNQTVFLDLLVLFCENESNLLLNQTMSLEKIFAFFLGEKHIMMIPLRHFSIYW
jgi:hypothetical protein